MGNGYPGEQLAAAGARLLEHGSVIRSSGSAERGFISPAGLQWRVVPDLRQDTSIPERIAPEDGRSSCLPQPRTGCYTHQVWTRTFATAGQACRGNATEEGRAASELDDR